MSSINNLRFAAGGESPAVSIRQATDNQATDNQGSKVLKFHDTVKKIAKIILQILEILRTILFSPIILLDIIVNKSSVRLVNLHKSPILNNDIQECHTTNASALHLLDDPTISYEWKKKLIEGAKQSIEIAGYCGGKPFKEFLEIIEKKLESDPNIKVRILSNVNTINAEEKEIYRRIQKAHPESFQVIPTKATWGLFPKLRRHENHTKMLIVDQKYALSGGTCFSNRLLKQGTVEKEGGGCAFLSNGNRDLDLLGEGEIAATMKQQFDHIWKKWKILRGKPSIEKLDIGKDLTQVNDGEKIQIDLPNTAVKSTDCDLIFSHPDEKKNSGLKAYIKTIDEAKNTISISNMVFNHKKIILALERAIKRGVDVEVITNGDLPKASLAGKSLGPRNRIWYSKLFKASCSSSQENTPGKFRIYEYAEKNILLHSKSMVTDAAENPTTIVGSYNLSRESGRCDDEQMIIVKSSEIAAQALQRFEFFKSQSQEVLPKTTGSISFKFSLLKGRVMNFILRDILN